MKVIAVLITGLLILTTNVFAENCDNCSISEEFKSIEEGERNSERSVRLQKRVSKAKSLANKDESLADFSIETDNMAVFVVSENKICILDRTKRLGPGPLLDGFWNSYFLNCKERTND